MISDLLVWLDSPVVVPRWAMIAGALALFGYFCVVMMLIYCWATDGLVEEEPKDPEDRP